jgi:hypothetical protein
MSRLVDAGLITKDEYNILDSAVTEIDGGLLPSPTVARVCRRIVKKIGQSIEKIHAHGRLETDKFTLIKTHLKNIFTETKARTSLNIMEVLLKNLE